MDECYIKRYIFQKVSISCGVNYLIFYKSHN